MNISAKEICFEDAQIQHSLQITNTSSSAIIFKIKITNTELFTIVPGKGFLKANSNSQIQIKVNKLIQINAKLLVSYSVLTDNVEIGNGFDKIWNSLSKDKIINQIIPIKRSPAPQKVDMYKKTDSPVYQAQPDNETIPNIQLQNKKPISNAPQLMNSLKSSSLLFKSIKDFDRCNSLSNSQILASKQLQKQLQKQRQRSKKLKDQLSSNQKKMYYYRDINQQHVNKSLTKQEPVEILNCVNIALIIFVCFMVGFFAAKYKLPQSWTL